MKISFEKIKQNECQKCLSMMETCNPHRLPVAFYLRADLAVSLLQWSCDTVDDSPSR